MSGAFLLNIPRVWQWLSVSFDRLDRVAEFFDKTETRTNFPNAFRILKVILTILVLIHWNACLFFWISYGIGFQSDGWVYNNTDPKLTTQYIYR